MKHTTLIVTEMQDLIAFMQGPDNPVLVRLVSFFSRDSRYCHPRELKPFWESLTESDKNYYRRLVVLREI